MIHAWDALYVMAFFMALGSHVSQHVLLSYITALCPFQLMSAHAALVTGCMLQWCVVWYVLVGRYDHDHRLDGYVALPETGAAQKP